MKKLMIMRKLFSTYLLEKYIKGRTVIMKQSGLKRGRKETWKKNMMKVVVSLKVETLINTVQLSKIKKFLLLVTFHL